MKTSCLCKCKYRLSFRSSKMLFPSSILTLLLVVCCFELSGTKKKIRPLNFVLHVIYIFRKDCAKLNRKTKETKNAIEPKL